MNTANRFLRAPFPYFGGKSKIVDLAWSYIGDVRNAIEPFAGTAVWMLRRPHVGQVETLNDSNGYVANFWRAVKEDAEAVAEYADWPVSEADMHARHRWLLGGDATMMIDRVKSDPFFYDFTIAGWWAWGQSCWIGNGWCDEGKSPWGLNALSDAERPQLTDAYSRGRGVNSNDAAETCEQRRDFLREWLLVLQDRLRPVRVCCGDWQRVCNSESTTTRLGTTGLMLDPPYKKTINGAANRSANLYANDNAQDVNDLCERVETWCLENGDNPEMRIVLCGLEGEYVRLDNAGWGKVAWKSSGYGNRTEAGQANAARERLWISPHCLSPDGPASTQPGLFDSSN